MKRLLLCFLALGVWLPSFSQRAEGQKFDKAYKFIYENDFFDATDYYYTQGVRWEFIFPFLRKNPVNHILLHLKNSDHDLFGVAPNQDCYTPLSIRRDTVFTGQRPFAGAIYLSFFRSSNDEQRQQRLFSEVDVGGVGPCSHCEETQKNIHKWLVNIQPLGWQFQVSNDIALDYVLNYEKGILDKKQLDLIAFANTRAGTLYDYAGGGIKMRIGYMENYFKPAHFSKHIQLYAFISSEARAVGYNATMQGGMFQKKNVYVLESNEISRALVRSSLGAVFTYKKISLEYTKTYESPEFEHALAHGWGHCNITVYF